MYGVDAEAAAVTRAVLVYVFDRVLRLGHPFMPFVTEQLWQAMPHRGDCLLLCGISAISDSPLPYFSLIEVNCAKRLCLVCCHGPSVPCLRQSCSSRGMTALPSARRARPHHSVVAGGRGGAGQAGRSAVQRTAGDRAGGAQREGRVRRRAGAQDRGHGAHQGRRGLEVRFQASMFEGFSPSACTSARHGRGCNFIAGACSMNTSCSESETCATCS